MGLFGKLANALFNSIGKNGLIEHYNKFLTSDGQFNYNIIDCWDKDYSLNILQEFTAKFNVEIKGGQNYGFSYYGYFDFEGWRYEHHMFKNYARGLTISSTLELNSDTGKMFEEALNLFNRINHKDLMHQIGLIKDENGKILLRVTRQCLFTPNIGNVETLIHNLRDLKEYILMLSNYREYSIDILENTWKKYAFITSHKEVDTAEEFWFSKEESSISKFTNESKIIENNPDSTVRTMINMTNGSTFTPGSAYFLNGKIITYKDFPYIVSMITQIKEGYDIPHINKEKIKEFCAHWNYNMHFSPSRMVIDENNNGDFSVSIIMTGLFADDCNTFSIADFLCTLHKATDLMLMCATVK